MGCVILDPVATGVDSKCAEFGAGCSRWIQFYVGSHGEFGKTPAWASIDSIRKEMGLSNFRLTLTSAVSLSRTLGATHVAVGEMSGAAGNLTIVYKVYVLATPNTPVATVTLSGSEQAIIDGLPAAASRITRALGLATPRIPQRCKATENGLRLMGKVGWVPTTQDHSEDLLELGRVAAQEPAAAVIYIHADRVLDRAITDGALHSLVVAAGSPLAQYSVVSRRANGAALAAGEMSRLGDSFPNSYLVNVALSYVKSAQNNAKEALRFAKIAVQCSPRNARTWLRLAKVYGEASQSIRQSRVGADISPDEWKSLNRLYLLSAAAALKSTQLDPTYPEGWLEVAQMACFSGDEELADQAYWKSLQLNANDHQALAWGMEMYQPKWLNNRSKLDKVVQMVVNAKYDALDVSIILADNIAKLDARYIEDSRKLKARIEKESRELVQKDPANFNGNAALAELALSENKGDESATHLLAMAKANPDNEETLRVLANAAKSKPEAAETIKLLQAELKRKPDSIKIRQALDDLVNWENKFPAAARRTASAPSNPEALQHLKLGQSLADMGKRDEAIEELKTAIKIDPKMGKAHYLLGMQLFYTNKRPEAATELQLASDLLPDDADILSNYGFVLQAIGKAKEAIPFLRRSVELNPKVFNSQQLYVFTLIYLKMAPESLAAAKDALAANDNDPMFRPMVGAAYELNNDDASALKEYQTAIKEQKVKIWQAAAHMDAGRLLWKMGQKDEARKEMQIVIDLEPRSYGMTAKQLLAQ